MRDNGWFFSTNRNADLPLIIGRMLKSVVEEDLACEEETESLLSARMNSLKSGSVKTNCLSSLTHIHENESVQSSSHKKSSSATLPPMLPSQKENLSASRTKHKESRLKKTRGKEDKGKSFGDVKLFEVHGDGDLRRPHISEVRGMKVSEFTGKGILILPNSKKFEGEWYDGNLIGEVKITFPNGDVYFGSVYNYQQHGKGYLYHSNGKKYVGDFSCGDFHGQGIMYNSQGEVEYDGEWRRGEIYDR